MDSNFISLMTYFFTGLAICLFIIILLIIKKRKSENKIQEQADYFDSDNCIYETDVISTKSEEYREENKLDFYKNNLFFHNLSNFFGSPLTRFILVFSKNLESLGKSREDLINILFLSESNELHVTTGFYDFDSESVQFRAGKNYRKGVDENIQQTIHTTKGVTNFFFFDELHDKNIEFKLPELNPDIKKELTELKKIRTNLYKMAVYKRVRAMSSDMRGTTMILCGCCVLGGFGLHAIIDLVF